MDRTKQSKHTRVLQSPCSLMVTEMHQGLTQNLAANIWKQRGKKKITGKMLTVKQYLQQRSKNFPTYLHWSLMKINTLASCLSTPDSEEPITKTRVCPDQSEGSLICRHEKEDDDYLEMMTVLTGTQRWWTSSLRWIFELQHTAVMENPHLGSLNESTDGKTSTLTLR